jgi:dihydropteroate synthase
VQRLPLLAGLGCRILVGRLAKAFVGRVGGEAEAARRVAGSLGVALAAAAVAILRVHDVAETVQALKLFAACQSGEAPAA